MCGCAVWGFVPLRLDVMFWAGRSKDVQARCRGIDTSVPPLPRFTFRQSLEWFNCEDLPHSFGFKGLLLEPILEQGTSEVVEGIIRDCHPQIFKRLPMFQSGLTAHISEIPLCELMNPSSGRLYRTDVQSIIGYMKKPLVTNQILREYNKALHRTLRRQRGLRIKLV